MNSKMVGNLTEINCLKAFTELGYGVSIPFGDCLRYDLVVDIKNKLYKIQCKTASRGLGDVYKRQDILHLDVITLLQNKGQLFIIPILKMK